VVLQAVLAVLASDPAQAAHVEALLPVLLPLVEQMSPETYGGAMLLGVDGVCIISHGSSTSHAMLNGIKVAQEMVERHVVDELRDAIAGG
jgi:glycerol-3-phosphate acyltransferase PlsX